MTDNDNKNVVHDSNIARKGRGENDNLFSILENVDTAAKIHHSGPAQFERKASKPTSAGLYPSRPM